VRRGAAALVVLGALVLGVHGILFHARLPARLPSTEDWSATARFLSGAARPGDAILLAPWWAERARQVLPDGLPVLAFPSLRGEDLVGVERVWLLSLPGAPGHGSGPRQELTERSATAEPPRRFGGIELVLHHLRAPTLPLAFFPDLLATALVATGPRRCAADAREVFRCGPGPLGGVASEIREIDALPRRCLRAPPVKGEPLVITFPSIPVGRVLRGHTGIVGEAALAGAAPVVLTVRVDGEEVGRVEEPPARSGWHAFEIDTRRLGGRDRTVSFTIAAEDVAERELCFDAYTQ
jgi:hypothetical protein